MLFGILTLITALAIAGVAAWFSIVGLMLLFSGMPMSIAVMAGTLEIGKLLTASWLYRYWNETSIMLRTYLTTAVVVLMIVTSIGIFGYLSKAASDQAGDIGDAVAVVERIDAQIDREENKIALIEDRILGIGGSVDISASIEAQEDIRDGAWARVQGDIDYNQEQIENVREQLKVDIAQQDSRLAELDKAVNELRAKGVEVVTLDEGGLFQGAETEKIDYIAQANELRASQQVERDEIKAEKQSLRDTATADINVFQTAIDNYRSQAQADINGANAEINRLRNQSSTQADDNINKINAFNEDIDAIYANIVTLKDEKFDAESKIRNLDREVGPIKYLAQLIYGSEEREILDQAIRLFILMLVFVFDPLAVMLVIAANQTLLRYGINLESSGPPVPPKDPDPEPEPEIEEISDEDYFDIDNNIDWDRAPSKPSAVDDAADVMSQYDGRDKTFFESINEPITNVDNQKTEDIVKQIEKTEKLEDDLNKILGGKTKAQLMQMAMDGGIELPAQLSKAEMVANVIANYDSITKKKNLKIDELETELKDSEYKYQKQLDELNDKYNRTLESLEDAKNSLDIKPKEVIIEKEIIKEVIKEVPVEVEKIVEVERKVEVPKEVVVTREIEVPGPERIVEVPGPERIVERIVEVEVPGPERIVEKIVEVPVAPKPKAKIPNSWTFTPKSAELPVDNADNDADSKYYIKKPKS